MEPIVDPAQIAPEVRRQIENDAECATVQFVLKATPDPKWEAKAQRPERVDLWERIMDLEQQAYEQRKELRAKSRWAWNNQFTLLVAELCLLGPGYDSGAGRKVNFCTTFDRRNLITSSAPRRRLPGTLSLGAALEVKGWVRSQKGRYP